MILAIDMGNSNIVVGGLDDNKTYFEERITTDDRKTSLEYAILLKNILEHDNPIEDGETIDGVADGQMCREIQWKCQYEDALIQPPRGVLDINMGNYASGGR